MGPKKKTKKKAKDALFMTDEDLEAEEEARKKAEQERLEKERLLKEMEEELRRAKHEKKMREKKEMEQEEFRNQILKEHCSIFRTFLKEHLNYLIEKRRAKEWQTYVSCNHLPFANDPPALNTFLYTWSLIEDKLNMNNVLKESEIILETIDPVEEYIVTPLDMKQTTVQSLREVKLNYYNQILKNIDKVTFEAIMDVGKYHKQIEPSQIEIYKESNNLMIWMWAWALEGRCEGNPKKKRPKRVLPKMAVTLPGILEVKRYHLRIFYTSFDPYSFQSESYDSPQECSDGGDLLEEIIRIRKMEVNALKERYMASYDEDVMPWWFLMDKEIMEGRTKKEQLKKGRGKKKKIAELAQAENVAKIKTEESETAAIHSENVEKKDSIKEEKKKSVRKSEDEAYPAYTHEDDEEDKTKRKLYRTFKPGSTQILYSRSMSDLLEKRKYDCTGPEYFPDPDPIHYLQQSDAGLGSSESSKMWKDDLFMAEKHTTFKAFMYAGDADLSDGVILRDINECLNRSDPSEENLSFTDRRVFLDWKSLRDISPGREAIREELEDILFGDTEMVMENGKIKYVKRNNNLRSIKELFNSVASHNAGRSAPSWQTSALEREKEQGFNVRLDNPKVSNVTEMREVETEIANLLDMAWQDTIDSYINKLMLRLDSSSLNLRHMMIIGGVFQFDFFEDEPQPFVNKELFKTQMHYGDYELKRVLFDQIPQIRIDLAAEAERQVNLAKRQKSLRKMSRITFSTAEIQADDTDSMAMGDDDLVWFVLKLPKKTIYFETPMAVRWNSEKMMWTTDDVYDVRWNEKRHECHFKLGKSGPFAIAMYRFCNLPYFNFSVKPSPDWNKNPEVLLELTTRNFPIMFKIKEETVTIDDFGYNRAEFVSHIIKVPFTVEELIAAMRGCGIDLFPDWDSFLYISMSLKKVRPLEEHTYCCMAFSSPSFEYTSSFHNSGSRDDRIFLQMRECVDNNVPPPKLRTLLVDPRKVVFVTTGKSGLPSEETEEGVGYTPDLKYLAETIASKKALRRMKKASKLTIGTLFRLLLATKILSYS